MSKQYRMSDVFQLPTFVRPFEDDESFWDVADQSGISISDNQVLSDHASVAIDTHDAMQDRIAELEKQNKKLDFYVLEEIENRDHWEEKATNLAESIGELLGVDVGEHSSANCPVMSAMDAINETAIIEERDQLKAQNAEVNKAVHDCLMLPGSRQDEIPFILGRAVNKPSAICLSSIQAKAIEDAAKQVTSVIWPEDSAEAYDSALIAYINQLRQQSTKGE